MANNHRQLSLPVPLGAISCNSTLTIYCKNQKKEKTTQSAVTELPGDHLLK